MAPDLLNAISQLPLGQPDIRCWRVEPAGKCSFRAIFKRLQQRLIGPSFPWKMFWKLEVWPKFSYLLGVHCWTSHLRGRDYIGGTPLSALCYIGGSPLSALCPMCHIEEETVEHLRVRCSFAQSLWLSLPTSLLVRCSFPQSLWLSLPPSIPRPACSPSINHWFW